MSEDEGLGRYCADVCDLCDVNTTEHMEDLIDKVATPDELETFWQIYGSAIENDELNP